MPTRDYRLTTVGLESASLALPDGASTAVAWDKIYYNEQPNVLDLATFPTRITIPPGFHGKMQMACTVVFSADTTETGYRQVFSRLSGTGFPFGYISATTLGGYSNGGSVSVVAQSPVLDVLQGDYWELFAYQNSGSALNVRNVTSTWWEVKWWDS